jgi:hypothetical protein
VWSSLLKVKIEEDGMPTCIRSAVISAPRSSMEVLTSIGLNLNFLFSRRQNKRLETKEKPQCQLEYPTLVDSCRVFLGT